MCAGEWLLPGAVIRIKEVEGSDNLFVGREVTFLKHRPHDIALDIFCVEVEHPDRPEDIVLIREVSMDFTNLHYPPPR